MLYEVITVMLAPVPVLVPKAASVDQFQMAFVPSEPPVTVRVLLVPAQVASFVIVIPVGSVDAIDTVTEVLTEAVVLQSPSALT